MAPEKVCVVYEMTLVRNRLIKIKFSEKLKCTQKSGPSDVCSGDPDPAALTTQMNFDSFNN